MPLELDILTPPSLDEHHYTQTLALKVSLLQSLLIG